MEDKKTIDLFQEVINDIKTIRNSIIPERTCYNLEMKWKELQKEYSKLSCVFLYLGCPYKKKESKSSNLPTNQIQNIKSKKNKKR